MKKILMFIAAATVLASCMEDKGNYDYGDAGVHFPAGLGGIEESYDVMAGEVLVIEPVFVNADDEEIEVDDSKYEYVWFLDAGNGVRDTVGRERRLEFPVQLKGGDHTLYLKTTNTLNDVSRHNQITLSVVTEFTEGWFVTKETDGGETDIDLVKYDDGRYLPDIIAMVNGASIPGAPVKTTYSAREGTMGFEYIDHTGTVSIVPVFIVATESEVRSILANDMVAYYDTQEIFMGPPSVINPIDMGCWTNSGNNYAHFDILVNDGKLYWLVGRNGFGTPGSEGQFMQLHPGLQPDKELHVNENMCKLPPKMADLYGIGILIGAPSSPLFFFDDATHTFRHLYNGAMSGAASVTASLQLSNVSTEVSNYDLVYMKEYNATAGLGVLKNRSSGKYESFLTPDLTAASISTPFASGYPKEIASTLNVTTATVRTNHSINTVIYSSSGNNEVYSYNVVYNTESKILTLPVGEEVVFMKDIRDAGLGFKHFVVLTNHSEGWTMRCYDYMDGGDALSGTEPVKTYHGTGKAKHALYRGRVAASSF